MSMQTISNLTGTLKLTTTVFLALLLGASLPGALSKVKAQTPTKANASSASPSGGQKEGIKVHGHWVIDVRNPDGTLATHREFENALTSEGRVTLARLLGRLQTNGSWMVRLENSQGAHPCEGSSGSGASPCAIVEPSFATTESAELQKNLTLTVNQSLGTLVLSGTTTAIRASTIDFVYTLRIGCPPSNSPQVCATSTGGGLAYFTLKVLAPPVNGVCPDPACAVTVVAGQIIQVSVTISFS